MNKISQLVQTSPTLVIGCKRPKLGQGKQRLAYTLGNERAQLIAEAMLMCALEDAESWTGKVILAISCKSDIAWAGSLASKQTQVVCQSEGNLGERINHFDRSLRNSGHKTIVYIGTDAPALTEKHYSHVCELLDSNSTVFCRAEDGGVTIMANHIAWPDLKDLPWSSPSLGDSLIHLCKPLGTVGIAQCSYDIDVASDLEKLRCDLLNDTRPARKRLNSLINPRR